MLTGPCTIRVATSEFAWRFQATLRTYGWLNWTRTTQDQCNVYPACLQRTALSSRIPQRQLPLCRGDESRAILGSAGLRCCCSHRHGWCRRWYWWWLMVVLVQGRLHRDLEMEMVRPSWPRSTSTCIWKCGQSSGEILERLPYQHHRFLWWYRSGWSVDGSCSPQHLFIALSNLLTVHLERL